MPSQPRLRAVAQYVCNDTQYFQVPCERGTQMRFQLIYGLGQCSLLGHYVRPPSRSWVALGLCILLYRGVAGGC
eukprot:18799-Pyramimonas_sp.AAC.1